MHGDCGWRSAPVVFDRVGKRFGSWLVLDDVSFRVGAGERVTLIGPTGAGKTTILRLLMTMLRPDSGTISVHGEYLFHERRGGGLVPATEAHIRGMRGRMTMLFADSNLFPTMRLLRNVFEAPVHVLGQPKEEAEQRARELLTLVGLGDKLDHYPAQLDAGQRQRAAIARALAVNPRVLLVDELTVGLDPEVAAEVLDVLRYVTRCCEATMLLVSRSMRFTADVSDRVLMVIGGKVIEDAPPARLFDDPCQERTRVFLRSVAEEH